MNRKTIKLTQERRIETHHLPPGTRVTLGAKEADALVKLGQAVPVAYDEDAKVPPPRKRDYLAEAPAIQTASLESSPRRAARIAGNAQ